MPAVSVSHRVASRYATLPERGHLTWRGRSPRVGHRGFLFILGLTPLLTLAANFTGQEAVYNPLGFAPPLGLVVVPWLLAVLGTRRASQHRWDLRIPVVLRVLLFLWLAGAVISLINFPTGLKFVASRFVFVGLILLAYGSMERMTDIRYFAGVYLIALTLLECMTLLQAWGIVGLPWGDVIRGRRIFEFLPNRTLGLNMSYGEHGILLSLGFAFLFADLFGKVERAKGKVWKWASLVIFITGLLVSQSRSTYIGFAAMLVVFAVVGSITGTLRRQGQLLFTLVLLLLAVGLLSGALQQTLVLLYNVQPSNVISRQEQIRFALYLIRQRPLVGIGYGAYFWETLGSLHNAFLNELVSTGVLFGSVYSLMLLWVIVSLLQATRNHCLSIDRRTRACSLLGAFVFAIVELSLFQGFYVEVLAVMLALAVRLSRPDRSDKPWEQQNLRRHSRWRPGIPER